MTEQSEQSSDNKQANYLSAEEQEELVLAAQRGDTEAFAELCDKMEGLVGSVKKQVLLKYEQRGVNIALLFKNKDIEQAGKLGLVIAAKKYKPGKGAKFSTYAYYYIQGAIKSQLAFEINRTGVAGSYKDNMSESLDNNESKLADSLAIDESSATDFLIASEEQAQKVNQFKKAIDALTEDEKHVLYKVYGIGTEQTSNTKKIARELGLSEIAVKRAISDAPKKMMDTLEE